jgi:thiol-disulfide isomerase/thioredoxin
MLEDAELHGDKCYRIAVDGQQGTSVFWIDANDGLLRKFEFPSDAFRKKFQVPKCSIWAEFAGARAGAPVVPAAFQFAVPEGAKLLKRLFPPPPSPPSPLLGRAPEDFAFVGLDGTPVKREAFKDKVAVLDMWATWCSWCFKGFPNLEKVYQQFKENDKVVILAVSRDEATVSDANLRDSFNAARVTVPIVRDSQQVSEKVLQVQVLPTMIVLGTDGTVQYFRMGYDAELAETLPKRIEELLAGKNLAQDELDHYQQELKEYDEGLNKELAEAAPAGQDGPEIARNHDETTK